MRSPFDDDSLPFSDALEIDRICGQFEAEYRAGCRPAIEDFLGDESEPRRACLRRELEAIAREQGALVAQEPSGDAFLRHLSTSGLLSPEEIATFLRTLPADGLRSTAQELAQTLCHQGKLTAFQAKRIRRGEPTGLVLGNYVLLDRLGQGGMGQVFKARHRLMDRIVALKVLPPEATRTRDAVQRFQREVKATAKLSHPHIVLAHDAAEADGIHFLVMEYVDGQDLASLVRQVGPLQLAVAVQYTLQAARGLEYAHRARRDPSRHQARQSDGRRRGEGESPGHGTGLPGRPSVAHSHELTDTGQLMGTLDYLSPEQATDPRQVNARTDIYSLGCTFHYLLIGKPPYAGETATQKLLAHRERQIPSLRAVQGNVSEELGTLFRRMLAKTPEAQESGTGSLM